MTRPVEGAARFGAFRYLPKPDDLEELAPLLRLVGEAAGLPRAAAPGPQAADSDGLLGDSAAVTWRARSALIWLVHSSSAVACAVAQRSSA